VEANEGVAVGWETVGIQNLNASKANIKTHTNTHTHTRETKLWGSNTCVKIIATRITTATSITTTTTTTNSNNLHKLKLKIKRRHTKQSPTSRNAYKGIGHDTMG